MKAIVVKAVILMMTFMALVACSDDKPEEIDENPLTKSTWVNQDDQNGFTISFDSDTQGKMRVVTTIESEEDQDAFTMEVFYKFNYSLAGAVVNMVCTDAVVTIDGETEQIDCASQSLEMLYNSNSQTLTLNLEEEDGGKQTLWMVNYSPITWPEIIHDGTKPQPPYNTDFDPAVFNNFRWIAQQVIWTSHFIPLVENAIVDIKNGSVRAILSGFILGSDSFLSLHVDADSYTYQNGVLTFTDGTYTVKIVQIGKTESGKFIGNIHVSKGDMELNFEGATGNAV